MTVLVSNYHMIIISVERYIAIVYPLHYETKFTDRRMKVAIAGAWAAGIIVGMTFALWLINADHGKCVLIPTYVCSHTFPGARTPWPRCVRIHAQMCCHRSPGVFSYLPRYVFISSRVCSYKFSDVLSSEPRCIVIRSQVFSPGPGVFSPWPKCILIPA